MGYDSNIKSAKSERRQRLVIAISILALTAACFLVATLLRPSAPVKKNVANTPAAAVAKMKDDVGKRLRAGGGGEMMKAAAAAKKLPSDAGEMNDDKHKLKQQLQEQLQEQIHQVKQLKPQKSEEEAAAIRADLEARVRAIKKTGVIMEADEASLELTGKLQEATRELIGIRYGSFGDRKFRVRLDLEFQSTIPDFDEKGKDGTLMIEMGPISLIPCSVYNFLEIARTWKKGAFHRNAGHVLQAISRSDAINESMPFQEYSKEYPHKRGTVGYAGRPSGPEFYVSIQDNSRAHGPGSQQQHNPYEADCIIGTVIRGMEDGTVDRIHTMPGKEFLGDKKKWVLIRRMHVLVPGDGPDGYVEFSCSPDVIPED